MLSRSPLKRKKRLKPVSSKRSVELKKYAKLREKFLLDQPWCEIGAPGCTRKATEIHHMRGRDGKRLLDRKFFAGCCAFCHRWIHNNPKLAREKGWMRT